MNVAARLTTLASNSADDPEPSAAGREIAAELEARFFAGQDDYEPWTPAFQRRVAQWLDVQIRGRRRVAGPLGSDPFEGLLKTLRGTMAEG